VNRLPMPVLAAVVLAAAPPGRAERIFGFEDGASLPYRERKGTTLGRAADYATEGTNALRFASAAWTNGMPEWPAFDLKPPVADWRPFDRLVLDIVNPGDGDALFGLYVTDAKVRLQEGLGHRFDLPSRGWRRYEIPLSAMPPTVDRSAVVRVHFFTERPAADLELHLDSLVLLRPGEAAPEPGPAFARRLAGLMAPAADAAAAALAAARAGAGDHPLLDACDRRLAEIRALLAAPDTTARRLAEAGRELEELPARAARAAGIARLRRASQAAPPASADILVVAATSMEKILPRHGDIVAVPAREVALSLARNEAGSLQLLVTPAGAGGLRGVTVTAGDLAGPGGAVLPASRIDCDVVGYVETKSRPPYGTPHVGWWPDPILDFLGPVDVAAGDVQSFWIRVRAPKDQPPGVYRGALTVAAAVAAPQPVGLIVTVRPFALPDGSPLPLAITFAPHDHPADATQAEQAAWRREADYPVNAWRARRLEWADFLADYRITYDSLYHQAAPDFEVLQRLKGQGRLGVFNLGYWYYFDDRPSDQAKWRERTLPRLREAYTRAKDLGLLEHAYLYGCDEVPTNHFAWVERAAAILKAEFPGVPVLTTTYDDGFGATSGLRSIDAFCPLTPKYDRALADAARAAGRKVWWYICCGPRHPHANMFVEFPAIEGRLLMGAMTARERPDGFLYYQISIWNSRRPIAGGPFTDWDPRSWTTYHGDGSWTCVGPGGAPVPTIRLENFRDGLDDLAAVRILEDLVKARAGATATDPAWLAAARAAIAVPESLVRSMTDYSRDPAVLLAWRASVDDLIAAAVRR